MTEEKAEYNLPEDRANVDIEVTTKGFPAYAKGLEKIKVHFDKKRYFDIKENGAKTIADVIWLKELDAPLLWRLELLARYIFKGIKVIGMFLWGYLAYRVRKVIK